MSRHALSRKWIFFFQRQKVQEKIDAKRAKFEEKKKKLRYHLHNNAVGELMTLERETILAYEIEELLEKLRNNQLDPVAVLEAYQVSTKIRFWLFF